MSYGEIFAVKWAVVIAVIFGVVPFLKWWWPRRRFPTVPRLRPSVPTAFLRQCLLATIVGAMIGGGVYFGLRYDQSDPEPRTTPGYLQPSSFDSFDWSRREMDLRDEMRRQRDSQRWETERQIQDLKSDIQRQRDRDQYRDLFGR